MDVLINVTPLVIAIIFTIIVMSRRREKRKPSAPQVYASQARQQEREALLDRLSYSAWNRYNINEVEELIGLIKAKKGFSKNNMRTRFHTIRKQHDGLPPGMIEVLIKRLDEPSIPCDYLAFLQLNSSLVGFTYEMGPLLRFHDTTQIRWRVGDFDSRTFVECLIGKATLNAAISEIEYIGSCIPPLRTLSIERSGRICLIGPEDSRRVAQFWGPLLAHTVLLSDNVKKEASRHFEEHFGGLSPLVTKKSWERWIILETGPGKTGTRIFPSFASYLSELVKMDERQAHKGNTSDLERILAASDREMWTPVLTAEA